MTMKKTDHPLDEELISFLEEKQYLGESESLGLMLMTYDDKPSKQVMQNMCQPIVSHQPVQLKSGIRKILH